MSPETSRKYDDPMMSEELRRRLIFGDTYLTQPTLNIDESGRKELRSLLEGAGFKSSRGGMYELMDISDSSYNLFLEHDVVNCHPGFTYVFGLEDYLAKDRFCNAALDRWKRVQELEQERGPGMLKYGGLGMVAGLAVTILGAMPGGYFHHSVPMTFLDYALLAAPVAGAITGAVIGEGKRQEKIERLRGETIPTNAEVSTGHDAIQRALRLGKYTFGVGKYMEEKHKES